MPLDRVCVVGVYMDVMHRREIRGIGVDAALEDALQHSIPGSRPTSLFAGGWEAKSVTALKTA